MLHRSGICLGVAMRFRVAHGTLFFVCCILSILLTGRTFVVPLLTLQTEMTADVFVVLAPVILLVPLMRSRMAGLESLGAKDRLTTVRCAMAAVAWIGCIIAGSSGLIYVELLSHDVLWSDFAVCVRDVSALFGVSLLLGSIFGAEVSWVAPSGLAVATVFLGRLGDAVPRAWATLIAPISDVLSLTTSLVGLLAGVVMFIYFGLESIVGVESTS